MRVLLPGFGLLLSVLLVAFAPGVSSAPSSGGLITIIKDSSVAGTGEPDSIEVQLTPAVAGDIIDFTINGYVFKVPTNNLGIAIEPFAGVTVGSTPVSIFDETSGQTIGNTTVHFIATPDPPDPTRSYFVVVQNPADANGVAEDVVRAFIFDDHGNPVGGASVTWSIESGTANYATTPNTTTSTPPPSSTGGQAVLGLNSSTVGNVDVQALVTLGAVTFQLTDGFGNNFLPVQFIQPVINPAASYIVAKVTPKPADGTSSDVVTAYVVDNSGQPVASGTITFTIETGTATMTTTGTIVNGVATATFTSAVVGSVQVQGQVSVNGTPTYLDDQANPANNYVTIQFVNPPPNLSLSYITPVITPKSVGGGQDEVEAYVIGTGGQPVADGTVITFTILTGTGTIVLTTTTTNGMATAFLTSPVVGSVEVQASYTDGSGNTYILNDENTPAQPYSVVAFVAAPPTNNPPSGSTNPSYYITVIQSATADGSDTAVVQLHITDGTNNEPDGYKVQFVVTSHTSASPAAIMSGTAPTTPSTGTLTTVLATNANGSIDIPITDLVAGSVTIEAYAWDPTTGLYDISFGTQTVIFTAGQPVSGQPGGGGAGGTNPGNGGLPPGGGGSGSSGGSGGGGDNSGPGDNSNFTVLFVREPYDYQLANGVKQDSIIAYISDINKNPVPGVSVTFFLETSPDAGTATGTAQIVGNVTVTTDDSGMARIAITNTMPGTVFVDATIVDPKTGNTVLIDGSYQIAHFITKPDVTNIQTALTVIVGEALADGSQQNVVKAHVVDVDGNVMPDQEVYFAIDSGTGTIVTPQPVMTDANGDAFIQITSKTVGYVLITAVVDSEKIVFGSPARVYFAAINIYVPRAFSPNGDGVNDLLKPILVGMQTFHYFNVYNRWGNLIYATQDPNQGWDGTFKGVPQPVETYLWIAEGIDENGRKVVAKGMTSLVR